MWIQDAVFSPMPHGNERGPTKTSLEVLTLNHRQQAGIQPRAEHVLPKNEPAPMVMDG